MARNRTIPGSMNRRTLMKGAATVAAASGFAATAGVKASATFAAPALIQGDVTLEVWGGVPAENGPQTLVDAFMEANPGVTVNYTRYVNDDTGNTQLDTALQGGTQIDLFFTYSIPRLGQRTLAGAAADLTPYIEADADIKNWVDTTEGIFNQDGVFYSLPTTKEPNFLLVNQRLLEDAGATLPEAGWTVDDFMALAEQLTSDTVYGAYSPPDTARAILGPDFWFKEGGTESNFDAPEFSENLERHKGMIDAGTAFPWTDVLAQDLRAYAQTPFLIEQNALWFTSSFSLRYVADKEEYPHDFVTTFAPFPAPAAGADFWNPGGINNWIQMKSDTANPDAAWSLIQFWLKEGAVYMLPAGKIPAYPGTDETTVVEGILGPDREELYDVAAYQAVVFDPATKLVTDTITTGSAEISQIVQGNSDRYLIGEISIEEWVTETKTQADEAIARASA
jgi:multiple sugar transport system substrate-binding protein